MSNKEVTEMKPADQQESEEEEEDDDESEDESEEEEDDDDDGVAVSKSGNSGGAAKVYPRDDSPEALLRYFTKVIKSEEVQRQWEREDETILEYAEQDPFDFPHDPENWREEDLKELWADGPVEMTEPGWDPNWVDEEEREIIEDEFAIGNDPTIAPFYVPYRRFYPVIPKIFKDISTPKLVIEELDKIEEFLTWVSFIFEDGSWYEGTVWDDMAHGKGVYVAEKGLVRYEGEWFQNAMEGHGMVEVEIPQMQPVPGSKLEEQMRAEGQIITRDFMSPEDRRWLEMDIEDSMRLARGRSQIPFYEKDMWITNFGRMPEKGRYRYAGQWKHGRMHGCGVYEVNERTTWGRFYFGELLQETYGCDADVSALHAGIAEVAAAKARMFVNKPDGMVREDRGPYSDPQHHYFYEEDEAWMAPGFINQFYEVPDYWKMYAHEVDQEIEMWRNSFYRAPLRLPMPSELEYWWANETQPEFVLVNKEPEPDPEDPSKLIYTEDPLIVHTPTGRLINYVDDEEHGIRLFWQPHLKENEDVDPEKAEFLPLGFEEFYGRAVERPMKVKEGWLKSFVLGLDSICQEIGDYLELWAEHEKKGSETTMEMLNKELEVVEDELSLEEEIEEFDDELKRMEEEAQERAEQGLDLDDIIMPEETEEAEVVVAAKKEEEKEEDDDEEDEDDAIPSSFGSVEDQKSENNDQNGNKSEKSPFAAISLTFANSGLLSTVPWKLQQSFSRFKEGKFQQQLPQSTTSSSQSHQLPLERLSPSSVSFPLATSQSWRTRITLQIQHQQQCRPVTKLGSRNHSKREPYLDKGRDLRQELNILSLHTPLLM